MGTTGLPHVTYLQESISLSPVCVYKWGEVTIAWTNCFHTVFFMMIKQIRSNTLISEL